MGRRERIAAELFVSSIIGPLVVVAVLYGDTNQEYASLGLFIAACAFLVSQRPNEQLTRIEGLLQRLVAAGETPKTNEAIEPGNWYIALDDDTGTQHHTELAGDINLFVGMFVPDQPGDHDWRVDHVDSVTKTAHATRTND